MKKLTALLVLGVLAINVVITGSNADDAAVIHPAKMSMSDIDGAMFEREDTLESTRNGNTTLDVTSLLSSDKKFASGLYKSGKTRWDIKEPYGVDEFMYFVKGGVTLTSSDGTKTVINAGDAVTIPKEWTGTWETDGYTKIWVIYSEDGSGLE